MQHNFEYVPRKEYLPVKKELHFLLPILEVPIVK